MEKFPRYKVFESPLRYPGGKSCIFPFFSSLFFENGLIGTAYAEPYSGGAGLALKLLFNEYVSQIYINDLDYSIYSFWKVIKEHNTLFCDWLEDVDVNVENWKFYKSIQKNADAYSELDIAKSTFFLNRTNISGVIKGGLIGGLEQNGKFKIDARFNKRDLLHRIQRIDKFKDRIFISNMDGLKFIKKIDSTFKDVFIYIDPPYVKKGAELYMNYFMTKDHLKLAKVVSLITSKWVVSYDNSDLINEAYIKNSRVLYKLSQAASNRIGDEILIFCNSLAYHESVKKLKSPKLL